MSLKYLTLDQSIIFNRIHQSKTLTPRTNVIIQITKVFPEMISKAIILFWHFHCTSLWCRVKVQQAICRVSETSNPVWSSDTSLVH